MCTGGAALDDLAQRGGRDGNAAFTGGRHRLREITIDGRLPEFPDDGGFYDDLPFGIHSCV